MLDYSEYRRITPDILRVQKSWAARQQPRVASRGKNIFQRLMGILKK